jgi:hypothetical protein
MNMNLGSTLQAVLFGTVSVLLVSCSTASGLAELQRELQSRLRTGPAASAPRGPEDTAAESSVRAAIQLVIHRSNFEQEQAIAARDSSIMKDTSTDDYYDELVEINQGLLDSGVTRIKLVALEWGSISISGNTATAMTYETWATTGTDGRTRQARDRNVYSLVLQSGVWKIQADDHPDGDFVIPTGGVQVFLMVPSPLEGEG